MRTFVFSLIILVCLRFSSSFYNQDVVKMIADVAESYDRPTAITAFLCWKPRDKTRFALQLRTIKVQFASELCNERKSLWHRLTIDTMVVADLRCPNITAFLKKASDMKLFESPFRWLLLGQPTNDSGIPPQLEDVYVVHSSEVIISRDNGDGNYWMYLVYKIKPEYDWRTEPYGIWNKSSGLHKYELMYMTTALRRRDLKGELLPVAFNVDDKETGVRSQIWDYKITQSLHSITRWGYQQMLPLYEFVNATRINIFTDQWGYYVNGSWNGIIGVIAREEADLVGTPMFFISQRLGIVNYMINPVQASVKFVFRDPPLSYQSNLFLLPFNRAVWCSLGGFVLILTIAIFINARWETKKFKILSVESEKVVVVNHNTKQSLSDVIMMIVSAITQQGSYNEFRGSIGRVVMFLLFISFVFLFTAYSASIVALLQSSSKSIRTLSDLLNSRLELGVENTSYNVYYFTRATEPVRKAIYETKVAPRGTKPKFMSIEEGIRRMQKHPFAFHMDIYGYSLIEKYFYEHEKCGLQEIPYMLPQKPWLTCRKSSPYAELLKIGLYRIHEFGMSSRANNKAYVKKPVCLVSGGKFVSVNLLDIYPPFLLLLYGTLLAFTLLATEIIVHRQQMTRAILNDVTESSSVVTNLVIEKSNFSNDLVLT